MALLRKINRGLLILLILVAFALLFKKTRLQTLPKYSVLKKDGAETGVEDEKATDTDIPVVICASEERIGAAIATVNSVYSNSRASIFFYIVTLRDAIKKIRSNANVTPANGTWLHPTH
ncbi:glycosyltransferase 8 domain-containing protein 2-like [Sinocyclocheilus grahami]|uniref:glycosyltransferase 8 domain-containing protein 2-like n=1 Tax=Sinocyclocheilus grahami TaxID=75366 RepID=UPI0007AD1E57|nr:PREDICTED: glycosyltransferase 8 domain-containing protein 2-like [Sinocyclocheilus grahami]